MEIITRNQRIIAIVLNLSGVAIFTQLVLNTDLWHFSFITEKFGADASRIEEGLSISIYITLAVVVIIVAFDVFGHLRALLRKK